MKIRAIVLCLAVFAAAPTFAQVTFGFTVPGLSIGINVPAYPQLVRIPGYPVYYAPQLGANFFFYDGMYWVYQADNWYASTWYNGPWGLVAPAAVPVYVLRVPVRYYRAPPPYFRGWHRDAPPRWGEYWGPAWQQSRPDWDRWNSHAVPLPAPVPNYQRQYSGNRYPQQGQQQALHDQYYRYSPQDPNVRQHYPRQGTPGTAAPRQPGPPDGAAPSGPVRTAPPGGGKRDPAQDG
jgi:hypothetical protein